MTFKKALKIAARYGIDDMSIIRENYDYAITIDGTRGKSAEDYFDGYMADTAYEWRCDDRAAADFENRAY